MKPLDDISIALRNYKCFAEQALAFPEVRLVNLVIGRNNTGKSALLDAIDLLTDTKNK